MLKFDDEKYLICECNGLIISITQRLTQADRKILTHLIGRILKKETENSILKKEFFPIILDYDEYKSISEKEPVTDSSELVSILEFPYKWISVKVSSAPPDQNSTYIRWANSVLFYPEYRKVKIVFSQQLILHARLFLDVLSDQVKSQGFCFEVNTTNKGVE
jgi:hypothetical protein